MTLDAEGHHAYAREYRRRGDFDAAEMHEREAEELNTCPGHPAGPFDPMGETVYCDGSCQS